MSNHLNRFYAAVSALAGHGDVKQRLIKAFEGNLATIEQDELPVAVKESFADLRKMLSGVDPLNGEGRVRATVRKMSIVEADACAQKMIDVYTELVRFGGQAKESRRAGAKEQPVVPPFLVKAN